MFDYFQLAIGGSIIAFIAFAFHALSKMQKHETANEKAQKELDKLAIKIAYTQISFETNLLSSKLRKGFRVIKLRFAALARKQVLFLEQGAASSELSELAKEASSLRLSLNNLDDQARDEIYWAKMARKSHKEATTKLSDSRSTAMASEDLRKARIKLLASRHALISGQYQKSWQESRLVVPLIELAEEKSQVNELILQAENRESASFDNAIIALARDSLEQACSLDDKQAQIEDNKQKLKFARLKLEKAAEQN